MSSTNDKEFAIYDSFKEADEADFAFYRSLTARERLEIALKIMEPFYDSAPRLERVLKIADLKESRLHNNWRVGI